MGRGPAPAINEPINGPVNGPVNVRIRPLTVNRVLKLSLCSQVADAAKKCADDFAASAAGPTIKRHAATRPKWQGLIDRFSKDCGFDEVAGISTPSEKVCP